MPCMNDANARAVARVSSVRPQWVAVRNAGEALGLEGRTLLHAGPNSRAFTIPAAMRSIPWRQFLDTAAAPPHDIYPNLDGPEPHGTGIIELEGRSLVC